MFERRRYLTNFLETLRTSQKDFLRSVYRFKVKKINWDIDQVLSESEKPVKIYFDMIAGTNIADEKLVDGWNPITEIVNRKKLLDISKSIEIENALWTDPDVLSAAEPSYALRRFSLLAYWNGVSQSVTTSRIPVFEHATPEWILKYYPWIPLESVMQSKVPDAGGNSFKLRELVKIAPDVHFEDSVLFMQSLHSANPNIGIIGFPYANDDIRSLDADNIIMFPDTKTFEDLSHILI
jgi:hypothetical protein